MARSSFLFLLLFLPLLLTASAAPASGFVGRSLQPQPLSSQPFQSLSGHSGLLLIQDGTQSPAGPAHRAPQQHGPGMKNVTKLKSHCPIKKPLSNKEPNLWPTTTLSGPAAPPGRLSAASGRRRPLTAMRRLRWCMCTMRRSRRGYRPCARVC